METCLRAIVQRNQEIESAAIRRQNGRLLVEVGDHDANWKGVSKGHSTTTHILVPITAGTQRWGNVEVRFRPLAEPGVLGLLRNSLLGLTVFVASASLLCFFLYLRKMLQHMNPSKVVPGRVRSALDTLAGGLLLLDHQLRIVLANQAFTTCIGRNADQLQGKRASDLSWVLSQDGSPDGKLPWELAMELGTPQLGTMIALQCDAEQPRNLLVNATPIQGSDGTNRGVLVSFDDVTRLEQKKRELAKMLDVVTRSREQIRRKNEELKTLATEDPLTSCLNRRAFFEKLEAHWNSSVRYDHPLSCVVLDIDHFKSINDRHGHSFGDLVLKKVAEALKQKVRDSDLICRYGGEEFCILLPHTELDSALGAAERFRRSIETLLLPNVSVSASLGVSSRSLSPKDMQDLIDQSDKALYAAKRSGRNRVVRWDEVPTDLQFDESPTWQISEPTSDDNAGAIPFYAVTALITALGYRDPRTAAHSRRVADLCVLAANGLLSARETYVLEIAALLHEIGRIGVPDSILLKQGPLTDEEWNLMKAHDKIGVEILHSAFSCPELARIVESHHAFDRGEANRMDLPTRQAIPKGARILSIADTYDALISDRGHRKGLSQQEAFAELRRNAGRQFDPDLVEHFIKSIPLQFAPSARRTSDVSVESALKIGAQLDRISSALDCGDFAELALLASDLKADAVASGVLDMAEIADRLELAIYDHADPELLQTIAGELLSVCRGTQTAFIKPDDREFPRMSDAPASVGRDYQETAVSSV